MKDSSNDTITSSQILLNVASDLQYGQAPL